MSSVTHTLTEPPAVLIVAAAGDAAEIATLLPDTMRMTVGANPDEAIIQLASAQPADGVPGAIVFVVADSAGLDALSRLRQAVPTLALVALTRREDARLRAQALACGAHDALALPGLHAETFAYALRLAYLRASHASETASVLRTLFDLDAQAMWICDLLTFAFISANRAAIETYGFSEPAFRSMSLADIRAPAAPGTSVSSAPPAKPARERHRTRDGREIEVAVSAQRIPLHGSEVWLVQARDITDERRAMRALESSERRFRDLFEQSTGFICIHDLDGTLLSVNPDAATALGRSVAALLGTPLRDLVAPHLRFLVDQYLQRIVRNGEDEGFMRVMNSSGGELIWQYRNRVHVDADGSSCVMGYAQDITELRAVERAFRLSEQRLRTIANTLPLKIAYLDAQQRIVFANEAYRLWYAGADAGVSGRAVRDVIGEQRYAHRQPYLARALAGERVVFESTEGEGDDGCCFEVTYIPEFAENRLDTIGVHAMLRDITLHKREQRRLTRLARVDSLSGLLNRAGFYERLDNALNRSRDQDALLAVFYLDIDHFKQVNDSHGHAVGDALIRAFAQRLADKVRSSDVVARLGGDEFTVVMEGLPEAEQVRVIGAKLVEAMRRPFELRAEGLTLTVGASIGIVLGRAVSLAAADFVARADAMLYAAKQAGRGTWRLMQVESPVDTASNG